MARADILDKALSMAAGASEGGTRRRRVFGTALLRTVSSAGDCHAVLAVPVYPRDAPRRDLERIGEDMYRAMGRHAKTQASPQG